MPYKRRPVGLEVRELSRTRGGVATVGAIRCDPGIATAVAGSATALVDQRHADAHALAAVRASAEQANRSIAAEEGVDVSWSLLFRIQPVAGPKLIEASAAVLCDVQGVDVRLPSGPLHDAANLAGAGILTVMLFVRSKGGLSHTREEDTDEADLALALAALERLVGRVIGDGQRVGGR